MSFAVELSESVGRAEACDALGLARASFYRWIAPPMDDVVVRPTPPRALEPGDRLAVLRVLNSEEFSDKAPAEVYATLLDRREYLCSIRTMYRILGENGEVRERRDQLRHPAHKKPELLATGPNQVWSWDITKLLGPVKWTYFYLYVVLDIFSRYPVGWMVAERESSALAARLIDETQEKEDIHSEQLTIHMDRGGPMTSKSFALLLADLGITKSHSRPHVSDDNPFSESHFKTVKYMPDFPERFGSIQDARAYCRWFFKWYAMEHHHSGIALLTPHQVHHGRAEVVTQARQEVLNRVYAEHPERFVRQPPKAPQLPKQVWINPPPETEGGNQETRTSVVKNNLPGSPRIDDLGSPRPVAPPEITRSPGAPATERGATPVDGTSPEQDQQAARNERQPATNPVPNLTPFPGMAGGRLTKKTMSALH
jgi:putative transposase